MGNHKSVEFNAVLNALRMMLTVIVPIITFPYTSRIFLAEGSGQLTFSSSYVQLYTLIASLGVYTYGVREGAKVRENKKKFSQLVKELLIINICSTIIAYVLLIISLGCFDKLNEYRPLILINSILIGFTALGMDWIYGVYEDYTYITVRQIVVQIITIVSLFVFVHTKEDIYIWAIIGVVPYTIANIINIIHAKQYFDFHITEKPNLRKHLKPILILFSTQVSSKVYNIIDTTILGFLANDTSTGLYSAAIKVNSIVIVVFTSMAPVFVPSIMDLLKLHDIDGFKEQVKNTFRLCLGLAIPASIGAMVLSEDIIIALAGSSFENAAFTMRILSPIIIISTFSNILFYCVLTPLNRESDVLKCMLAASVLNVTISIFLTPFFKQNGAATGSIIAEIICLFLSMYYVEKSGIKISQIVPSLRTYLDGSFIIAIVCIMTKLIINSVWISLAVSIILSIGCYFLVLKIKKDPLIQALKCITKRGDK